MSDDDFRKVLTNAVAASGEVRVRDPAVLQSLCERVHYVAGDFHDAAAYAQLKTKLDLYDKQYATNGNRIFYTATPASLYGDIAAKLAGAGLVKPENPQSFVRMIVEKPFGRDLASAKALNSEMLTYMSEDQIYRIDHYLGQRNRSEHFGSSFCQRHLRADLEPALR